MKWKYLKENNWTLDSISQLRYFIYVSLRQRDSHGMLTNRHNQNSNGIYWKNLLNARYQNTLSLRWGMKCHLTNQKSRLLYFPINVSDRPEQSWYSEKNSFMSHGAYMKEKMTSFREFMVWTVMGESMACCIILR